MTLMKHLLSTDNVLCPTLQTKKKKEKKIAWAQTYGMLHKEFQEIHDFSNCNKG